MHGFYAKYGVAGILRIVTCPSCKTNASQVPQPTFMAVGELANIQPYILATHQPGDRRKLQPARISHAGDKNWQKLTTDPFFLSTFVRHWIHLYFWFQASSLAASLLSSFSLLILASLSFVRTLYFILYAHKWEFLMMRLFSMLYLLNDHLPHIVQ